MAIPENLRVYSRKAETFNIHSLDETVKARKGFAVDIKSKNFQATASNWSQSITHLAPTLNRFQVLFEEDGDLSEDTPNTPIKLRLVSLEHRGQGGRAYKVVTETGYIYDFREDALMDVLTTVGVSPKGHLNGEFVWASIGAQMKLILVGGKIWKSFQKDKARQETKKIDNKDLEVGCVYETKNGGKTLFLGWGHTALAPNKKVGVWRGIAGSRREWDPQTREIKYIELTPEEEVGDLDPIIGSRDVIKKISGPHDLFINRFTDIREPGIRQFVREYEQEISRRYNISDHWGRPANRIPPTKQDFFQSQINSTWDRKNVLRATLFLRTEPIVIDPRLVDFFPPKV